mgnify:CR=1 FL=1
MSLISLILFDVVRRQKCHLILLHVFHGDLAKPLPSFESELGHLNQCIVIDAFHTNVFLLNEIMFRFDQRVEVRHEIIPSFIEDLVYFLRVMELQEYSSASPHQVAASSVR